MGLEAVNPYPDYTPQALRPPPIIEGLESAVSEQYRPSTVQPMAGPQPGPAPVRPELQFRPSAPPTGFIDRLGGQLRPIAQPVPQPSPFEIERINDLRDPFLLLKPFEWEAENIGRPITRGLQTVNRALMYPAEQIPYVGPQIERAREAVEPIQRVIGENVFVPSNLLPGIGWGDDLMKAGRAGVRPFARGLERQGGVAGVARRFIPEEAGGTRLTRDAESLLDSLDQGAAQPAFISKNLERVARENGIRVDYSDTPDEVIGRLRRLREFEASTPGLDEVIEEVRQKASVADKLAASRAYKTEVQPENILDEMRASRGTMPPEATSGLEQPGVNRLSDPVDAASRPGDTGVFSLQEGREGGAAAGGFRGGTLGGAVDEATGARQALEPDFPGRSAGEIPPGQPPRPPVDLFPEPPEPPSWEDAVAKLKRGLKQSAKRIAPNEVQRSLDKRQRIAMYREILERERAAGTPTEEALAKARAALSGEYSKFTAPEFGLTQGESEALWKRVADFDYGGKTFKQVNTAQAMTRIAAGEPLRRFEIRLLREVFGDDFGKLLEKAGTSSSTWDKLVNTLTLPRTLLSSFDLSYPFRQGAKTMVRHPKEFYGNIGTMVKAWFKQGVADSIDDLIRNDDLLIPVTGRHGGQSVTWGEVAQDIDILRPLEGGPIGQAEEGFLSAWARKIPGVRGSERSFITYGNKLRSDIGKYWVQRWIKNGVEITPKKLDDLGAVLNRLTGRGTLGKNVLSDTIQALGWAPKYRASGPQAFLQMFHKDAQIRQVAIENMLTWFGAGTAMLGLAKVTGAADVEIDPRSTDFGKMRIGDFRLNIWGTDQVLARTVAQIVEGEKKMDTGEVRSIAAGQPLLKYLRSGLSPENSVIYDLFSKENYSGQRIGLDVDTLKREWDERLIPLAIQDIKTTWEAEGPLTALLAAPGIMLGASTSAYEPSFGLRRNQLFEEKTGHPYNPESAADRAFAKNDPDLKALAEENERESKASGWDDISLSEKSKKEIAQLEQDQGIIRLAQAGLAGNKAVAERWSDIRGDFLATRSGIYIANQGDYGEPKTEAGKLADQYYRMNPKSAEYMDDNGEVDWDKYDADRKAILAKMTPEDAKAIQDTDKFQNPDAEKFDRQYREARELRNNAPAKFRGITKDQQEGYYEFSKKVADERKRLANVDPRGRAPTEKRVAYTLAKQSGDTATYKTWRILQSSTRQQKLVTPEYDGWLRANRSRLEMFYPDLYSTATIKRLKRPVRRAA